MAFQIPNLSGIFSKVKGALSHKDGESVVGIDIGTSSIKIVQLAEKHGSAVLETYGEIALGPYNEAEVGQASAPPIEKVTEALKDVIKEANVTSAVGGIAVPLSASLISLITLPTKDEDDLAAMVPIEARKYIPVPVSEVTLDWFVIPEAEADFLGAQGRERTANSTDVLVVAIHNTALQRYQSIIAAAGLSPRFYEIEPFSIARAAYEHGTAPVMVIDFGASGTRVYVIEFGIIDVSHTVTHGGQDMTLALAKSKGMTFVEAERTKREKGLAQADAGYSTLEFVFAEARRIYLGYQRKEGKAISKIILVGGGAELKGITDIAARNFDAPVTLGSPFERVSAPAFIAEVLHQAGPSFCSAVGLALRAIKG
jgi:type IV pilus assembly protein PilM